MSFVNYLYLILLINSQTFKVIAHEKNLGTKPSARFLLYNRVTRVMLLYRGSGDNCDPE